MVVFVRENCRVLLVGGRFDPFEKGSVSGIRVPIAVRCEGVSQAVVGTEKNLVYGAKIADIFSSSQGVGGGRKLPNSGKKICRFGNREQAERGGKFLDF